MLRIHAGYHKCLTMLFLNVMSQLYNNRFRKDKYRHFESIQGSFYNLASSYELVSTNGFAIDLKKLNTDFRITRFIRDPRDLVVSGYFYHKKGSEPWFRMKRVTPQYWADINGAIPDGMPFEQSYAEYLQGLSLEDGLLAEIEFRKHHFESMLSWEAHPNIKIFRYEELIADPTNQWAQVFDFLDLPSAKRKKGMKLIEQYTAPKRLENNKHVRNPSPNQWKKQFTPKVADYFQSQYGNLLKELGYHDLSERTNTL